MRVLHLCIGGREREKKHLLSVFGVEVRLHGRFIFFFWQPCEKRCTHLTERGGISTQIVWSASAEQSSYSSRYVWLQRLSPLNTSLYGQIKSGDGRINLGLYRISEQGLISPFYRWGNWTTERSGILHCIIQQITNSIRFFTLLLFCFRQLFALLSYLEGVFM